jgi:RNA polymerase sigma-70 factor (ECF subfamily)
MHKEEIFLESIALVCNEAISEITPNEDITAAVFEDIFEAHYKRVYNFCAYRINNHHETEDLVSMVFEKVITKYGTYRPSVVPLEAWIITIAKNVVNDYFRQRKKRACIPLDFVNDIAMSELSDQPEEILISHENKAVLMQALNVLSEKERTVVAMRFAASLRNIDIASIMSLSETNVGAIIHRSLKKMRRVLEGESL